MYHQFIPLSAEPSCILFEMIKFLFLGVGENSQQELWRWEHCLGRREACEICTQVGAFLEFTHFTVLTKITTFLLNCNIYL